LTSPPRIKIDNDRQVSPSRRPASSPESRASPQPSAPQSSISPPLIHKRAGNQTLHSRESSRNTDVKRKETRSNLARQTLFSKACTTTLALPSETFEVPSASELHLDQMPAILDDKEEMEPYSAKHSKHLPNNMSRSKQKLYTAPKETIDGENRSKKTATGPADARSRLVERRRKERQEMVGLSDFYLRLLSDTESETDKILMIYLRRSLNWSV